MNTQIEIAEGMLTVLRTANPTIDESRINMAHRVSVKSIDELYRLIPAQVGKQIWVIPLESAFMDRATRQQDRNVYTMGVLAVDRLDEPNEQLLSPDRIAELTTWANARIAWVKDYIRIPLASTEAEPVTGAMIDDWRVNELIDPDLLHEHGIFWCDIDFDYAIDEANH